MPIGNVFVFTAGNAAARAHLTDSIVNPIAVDRVVAFFDSADQEFLRTTSSEQGLFAWGAVPGPQNSPRWAAMRPGDSVLCVYDNRYRYFARVLRTFDNEQFAKAVWGTDDEGNTWRLVYLLTPPQKIDIPVPALARYLNESYRGFFKISDEKVRRIEEEFGSVHSFIAATISQAPDDLEQITREDVLEAITDFDRNIEHAFGASTTYDLVFEDRRYPPKAIFGLAARRIVGRVLRPDEFTGGDASRAFRILRRLGFAIEAREPETYLLIRLNEQSKYADELGVSYHFTTSVPNYTKLAAGAYVAVDRRTADGVRLIGYGRLLPSEPTVDDNGSVPDRTSRFAKWAAIEPPIAIPSSVQSRIQACSGYNVQHAIRVITRDIFNDLVSLTKDVGDPSPPLAMRVNLSEAVKSFSSALRESSVSFGADHETLVASFVASLATKPLVILTGLSGSGKTQIALRFGQWLGGHHLQVVAVRPDWTGAESLFGYEDGLKPPSGDGRAAWSVPAPLEFMLRAFSDPRHPYLLLLDEMNLAHVERYFADVLSGMESGEPCLPNLVVENGVWRTMPGGPAKVPFPRNVWVVGTVNVDETTYMFSPKVLDRATTFEFRVSTDDLSAEARKPTSCRPGEAALVRGLLTIAKDDQWHNDQPASFETMIAGRLKQLHEVLARFGLEFGHRAFYEAMRFSALAEQAGLSGPEGVLDRIVLQKVLPRFHGSRRRLELPLLAMARYCRDLPEAVEGDDKLPTLRVEQRGDQPPRLPMSYDKLCRMLRVLRANQFASFTE